jgi:hypothetical protein
MDHSLISAVTRPVTAVPASGKSIIVPKQVIRRADEAAGGRRILRLEHGLAARVGAAALHRQVRRQSLHYCLAGSVSIVRLDDGEQLRSTAAGVVLEMEQAALELARSPDSDRCPVRALEAWLRQARMTTVRSSAR